MRISDWSSDVCSSDLSSTALLAAAEFARDPALTRLAVVLEGGHGEVFMQPFSRPILADSALASLTPEAARALLDGRRAIGSGIRSEERRVGKEWVSTCSSRWAPDH